MQRGSCSTIVCFLWAFILLCCLIFDLSISAVTIRHHTPRPKARWKPENSENSRRPQQYIVTFGDHELVQTRTHGNKVRTRLEIEAATIGDQGVYSCLASNRYGYDLKSIKTLYHYEEIAEETILERFEKVNGNRVGSLALTITVANDS